MGDRSFRHRRSAGRGIDKILLVFAAAFTDRISQHRNVIAAAKEAGVRHLIYTSIQRGLQSILTIPMVTESDIATEHALKVSGLDYTILFNSLYLDAVPMMLGATIPEGDLHAPGGIGRGALVARRDLAEANAVILSEPGHENRSYVLGASEAVSLAVFASIVGRPVRISRRPFRSMSTRRLRSVSPNRLPDSLPIG